ncbi:MAG: FAD-dependent oxidoreductase [Bacillota bacterium]
MKYDCIVIGGGTAGACAGIAAARNGLKTLIVESFGFLGGTQTGGLVTPLMSTLIADPDKANISGLNNEIIRRMEATGDANGVWFNPEELKFVLEELAVSAGAEILYFTQCIGVTVADGEILCLQIFNKAGIQTLAADYFIDCSGDADVAIMAGVPYESGSPKSGKNQHISLRFECGGVNLAQFAQYMTTLAGWEHNPRELHAAHTNYKNWDLSPVFAAAVAEGLIELTDGNYFQMFSIPGKPDAVAFNCPEIKEDHNGANPEHLSKAVIKGRQMIRRYLKFMRAKFPGFEQAYINQVATQVGVRETRRIVGDYVLTAEDVAGYAKFTDGITRSNWYMDVHGSDDEREQVELIKSAELPAAEKYYDVPYRCMFSSKISNLLVAGRCISSDFSAQSSYRIIPTCRALGEVAGHAAFLAKSAGCSVGEITGEQIQLLLRANGAGY